MPFLDGVAAEDVAMTFGLVRFTGDRVLHPLRSGRPHPHLAVMEHCRIAGTHLRGRDPHVRREVRLHEHVLVVDGAARRQLERLRHLDDDVGLDVPAAVEGDRRRGIGFVARGCAVIDPRVQRRDLAIDQTPLVGEVADTGIGKPWRHLPARTAALMARAHGLACS